MAPRCIAAESNQWNSGRLVSISAIVAPRSSPRPASPAATRRTLSAYSRQLIENSSSFVRSAQRSGWASAVTWKASATVAAAIPGGRPDRCSDLTAIGANLPR